MIDFSITTANEDVVFHLPTSINEIDANYLKEITAGVHLADHYSLVCLVYHDSLSNLIFQASSKKKDATVGVVPIFVKCGTTDSEFIKSIECTDKIIVAGTQLQLGYHVVVPNNHLSLERFTFYCRNSTKNIYQDSLKLADKDKEVYFLEFKAIPNSDIIGNYSKDIKKPSISYVDNVPNVRGEA